LLVIGQLNAASFKRDCTRLRLCGLPFAMSFGDSSLGDRVMAGDTLAANYTGHQVGETVAVAIGEPYRLHKAVGDDWTIILLGLRLGNEVRGRVLQGMNVTRLIPEIVHFCSCNRCWPLKSAVLVEGEFKEVEGEFVR
jgi:hypothetical protein